jgi:hypothetical protein
LYIIQQLLDGIIKELTHCYPLALNCIVSCVHTIIIDKINHAFSYGFH